MDPRRFPFALICMWDGEMRDSLQAVRQHLGECSGGKIRDLMCGHCELRTSWWPMLCDHLNQPGMETKAACRPEFRMSRTVPKLFSSPLPSLPPSTLRDVSMRGKRYRPEQLVSFRGEAARLRRSSDRSPNIPSSLTTVVCIEPDPGPRSTLEESPTTIAVASLTGRLTMWSRGALRAWSFLSRMVLRAQYSLTPETTLRLFPGRPQVPRGWKTKERIIRCRDVFCRCRRV